MPILALIFGFFAATAALLAQVFFSLFLTGPAASAPSLIWLISAATLEEGAKLAFLLQLGKRSTNAISPIQAILFGLGFIVVEIALVTMTATASTDFLALGAMAGIHLLGTLIIYASLRLRENYPLSPLFSLIAAVLIHTLYNSSL
ncbi:MAG: PrsW family glutamic-type intramembrane protease [Candidatus Moraniibacteriota bacterium]